MMRVLVTGAAGFVGRYMCDYLSSLNNRPQIIATDVVDCNVHNCDSFHKIDLLSSEDTANLIKQTMPDCIIHLAGIFGTEDFDAIYRANVLPIFFLLEASLKYRPDVIFIATGSAAEYGKIRTKQLPIAENTECNPVTSYGLSKKLATEIVQYYYRKHNLCTMIVRPFQLIGKGVTTRLAPGAFASQLQKAICEGTEIIKVGNLESSRDFLAIEDAVVGIWSLCKRPACGQIFNLCSGKATKISDLLNIMIAKSGAKIRFEVDPSRLRGNSDISDVYGSYEKIRNHCGWHPEVELEKSINSMFV
jgi:GDP-4-dehydro-6-deoxy-D-mannose reductase